jgi:hypothetical protein
MLELLRAHTNLVLDATDLPFNEGRLGELAARTLPLLETLDVAAALAEVRALLRAHPRRERAPGSPWVPWPAEVNWVWGRLGDRCLARLGNRERDEVLFDELDDGQIAYLRFGIEHDIPPGSARRGLGFMLPDDAPVRSSWRRFLGLVERGPLDQPLSLDLAGELRAFPIWKWFRLLTRDAIDAAAIEQALRSQQSDAEIVALCRDLTTQAYALPKDGPRCELALRLLEQAGGHAPAGDTDAIRYVLEKLAAYRVAELKQQGWTGGPFVPPAR